MRSAISTNDLTFEVELDGPVDGEPVVLLHGFPESGLSWSMVTPPLVEAGFRVIVPDQRGYSPEARPSETSDYDVEQLVNDVLELMDVLGLDSAHIVGHDWGASVAWVLAATHPDRVRSLTAVSVPHLAAYNEALRSDPDQQERSAYIGLMRQEGKAESVLLDNDATKLRAMYGDAVPAEHVDAYVDLLSAPGAMTAALNWYRAMTSALGRTPAVPVATTFVWSDGDTAIGRAGAERCGDFVTGDYKFVELPGVSHWIPEEEPARLAAEIIERVTGTSHQKPCAS